MLILGSASPRRQHLLAGLGVDFEIRTADVDEAALADDDLAASVQRSASAKFDALASSLEPGQTLLTADTLVGGDGAVLGKPVDDADAIRMVSALSGHELTIVSALVYGAGTANPARRTVTTVVQLRPLTATEIEAYVATGAAGDKAGALELQGRAAGFIASLDGCWSNVVGLPVCSVRELLGIDDERRCSELDCGRGFA